MQLDWFWSTILSLGSIPTIKPLLGKNEKQLLHKDIRKNISLTKNMIGNKAKQIC